jgi:two-component system sensor histidine kinase TctE
VGWAIALKKSPTKAAPSSPGRGLFQREQRSLFGEILDWMLTPLLLLWPLSLALTWWVAQNIASKPFDRNLVFQLETMAQQLQRATPGEAERWSELLDAQLRGDEGDLMFYQMMRADGRIALGDNDLPLPGGNAPPQVGQALVRDGVMRGQTVRVAYMWMQQPNATPGALALLQVAETTNKRATLATEIIKGVMVPQFVILPLAVLLVWLALVRGIRPLNHLEARIRARRPDDLSPLDDQQVPQEVAPLVSSINDLLTKLKTSLSSQRRFLADAAHQLKTPLAGLRMQADLAQRQTHAQDLQGALQHIARASVRATHTVNQLLALARAETTGRVQTTEPVDLAALVIEAVQDGVSRALNKRIDLGYEGPERLPPECLREGNPVLLMELIRNLLDNALQYVPEGGRITARVLGDPFSGVVVVQVEDDGPGIAPAERELVLQPFYRALGTNVEGSGLGLAIVQQVATQHGGQVEMSDAHPRRAQPGLLVSVRFGARRNQAAAADSSH